MVSAFEQTLLAVMMGVIMLGMGAALTPQDFRSSLKRPFGLFVVDGRRPLIQRVDRDGHHQPVEQGERALQDVEVTVGDRIERPRVDRDHRLAGIEGLGGHGGGSGSVVGAGTGRYHDSEVSP